MSEQKDSFDFSFYPNDETNRKPDISEMQHSDPMPPQPAHYVGLFDWVKNSIADVKDPTSPDEIPGVTDDDLIKYAYFKDDQASTGADIGFTPERFGKALIRHAVMRRRLELGEALTTRDKDIMKGLEGMISGWNGEIVVTQLFSKVLGDYGIQSKRIYRVMPTPSASDALNQADVLIKTARLGDTFAPNLVALGLKASNSKTLPDIRATYIDEKPGETEEVAALPNDPECLVVPLVTQYRDLGGDQVLEHIYRYINHQLQLLTPQINITKLARDNFEALRTNNPQALELVTETVRNYLKNRYTIDPHDLDQIIANLPMVITRTNAELDQRDTYLAFEEEIAHFVDIVETAIQDKQRNEDTYEIELPSLKRVVNNFWPAARSNPAAYPDAWQELAAVYVRLNAILKTKLPNAEQSLRRGITSEKIRKAGIGIEDLASGIRRWIDESQSIEAQKVLARHNVL